MQTISLKRFIAHPDGRVEALFTNSLSGESGRIWGSLADLLADLEGGLETEDTLIRYVMAYWLARDADLSVPALVLDKTLTVDFATANPIRLQ